MKVVSTAEMREIEKRADAGGLSYAIMMENAGKAVADEIGRRREVGGQQILVLVGPGNNGGDGLVAARHLHDRGAEVAVYLWKRREEEDDNLRQVEEREIAIAQAEDDASLVRLKEFVAKSDIVVDALLGTGVSGPIRRPLKEILEVVKNGIEERREVIEARELSLPPLPSPPSPPASPWVVAVDVPTGLNCDTGAIDPAAFPADLTVTFAFPKLGQFLFPGAEQVGELVVADIGIPITLADGVAVELATPAMVANLLPPRPLGAHKGTFGKVLVVAGSVNYTGAPYLASAAATRVGSGLVTLAVASSIYPVLATKLDEVTFLVLPEDLGVIAAAAVDVVKTGMEGYKVLLLGPGLGREKETVEFVHRLLALEPSKTRGRVGFLGGEEGRPADKLPSLVIDADGLNALADLPHWWETLPRPGILTPHPGEMARLMGTSTEEVRAERLNMAREMAQKWGQVVVLKGAYTLIAEPEGQVTINPFANPGLATAGSGDVLAGAIAGLLAQGLTPYQAAVGGAYLHGLAGELVRQELGDTGPIAGDLLPALPRAIKLTSGQARL
ncbi:MAG: NAD(P)H-hydrate dehydratase [Anaerolineae bacterium]